MISESMLVTQHTWGLDHKTFLPDFVNHRQSDLDAARMRDQFEFAINPRELGIVMHRDDSAS